MPHPDPEPALARRAAGVYPDFGAVGAATQLASAIGALLTVILILAVLMLAVCAAAWAIASSRGNYQAAAKARAGLYTALGAAALAGAAVAWLNFLLRAGAAL